MMASTPETDSGQAAPEYVMCMAPTAPLRAEAREGAEMVNQLLLGETAQVLERLPRWLRVAGLHDGYEGWLSITQAYALSAPELEAWRSPSPERRCKAFLSQAVHVDEASGAITRRLWIPLGAVLPAEAEAPFRPGSLLSYPFGSFRFVSSPSCQPAGEDNGRQSLHQAEGNAARILDTALDFMGVSYLWGGRSMMGIDCSGFTQLVMQMHGYAAPRDASQQVNMPETVASAQGRDIAVARAGDIIYFSFDGQRVAHVGFYMGNGLLLHASGSVKLEYIDKAVSKRNTDTFAFNERLSSAIYAIQRLL